MRKFKCIKSDKSKHKGDSKEFFIVGNIYNEGSKGGVLSESGYEFTDSEDIIKWLGDLCGYYLEEVFDEEIKEDKKVGKFKVGDIIVGNNTNRYIFTSKGTKCKVIEIINEKEIKVNIIDSPYPDESLEFKVKSKDFDLVESSNSKTFTITTSDTTTTLTDGTHTTSINRYYTDKHDDMIALEEVVKKYKSEMEEIESKSKEPKVGDMVKVVDDRYCYSTYYQWFFENKITDECAMKWRYNHHPNNSSRAFRVVATGKNNRDDVVIALITDDYNTYLINIEGLEVIK